MNPYDPDKEQLIADLKFRTETAERALGDAHMELGEVKGKLKMAMAVVEACKKLNNYSYASYWPLAHALMEFDKAAT